MNDNDIRRFVQRITALSETLGYDRCEEVLQDFGELVRDVPNKNFRLLADMLQKENTLKVKEWLKVAGMKYFDIYDQFSHSVWQDFPPNKESFETLVWMAKLPLRARHLALKLSITDLSWIMNELPERFLPHLLGGDDKTPEVIHAEIVRLAEIPDKESREPWQDSLSYLWAAYGFYIMSCIALLIIIYIVLRVRNVKNSVKADNNTVVAQGNTPVVNINLQPFNQPSELENIIRKKYDVKLHVSAGFAPQLNTILWDMSQKILPAPDNSGARILSVELGSLDNIAKWISNNRENIEVLQPEELKIKLQGEKVQKEDIIIGRTE